LDDSIGDSQLFYTFENSHVKTKYDLLRAKDICLQSFLLNVTPEKWVILEHIATHLSVRKDTVRTWVKDGKLPFSGRQAV